MDIVRNYCSSVLYASIIDIISVTKMLNPPIDLTPQESGFLEYSLGLIPADRCEAAQALLPLLNHLKSGPFGRNQLQHPPPTIFEAINDIQDSPLLSQHKTTLIECINEANNGRQWFLPTAAWSVVAKLRENICSLERCLATERSEFTTHGL